MLKFRNFMKFLDYLFSFFVGWAIFWYLEIWLILKWFEICTKTIFQRVNLKFWSKIVYMKLLIWWPPRKIPTRKFINWKQINRIKSIHFSISTIYNKEMKLMPGMLWTQLFTSLMADLCQDIRGVSSFSRCLNSLEELLH